MKKVWVVSETWDDYLKVSHIFDSKEKAQSWVKTKYGIKLEHYSPSHQVSIDEFELE